MSNPIKSYNADNENPVYDQNNFYGQEFNHRNNENSYYKNTNIDIYKDRKNDTMKNDINENFEFVEDRQKLFYNYSDKNYNYNDTFNLNNSNSGLNQTNCSNNRVKENYGKNYYNTNSGFIDIKKGISNNKKSENKNKNNNNKNYNRNEFNTNKSTNKEVKNQKINNEKYNISIKKINKDIYSNNLGFNIKQHREKNNQLYKEIEKKYDSDNQMNQQQYNSYTTFNNNISNSSNIHHENYNSLNTNKSKYLSREKSSKSLKAISRSKSNSNSQSNSHKNQYQTNYYQINSSLPKYKPIDFRKSVDSDEKFKKLVKALVSDIQIISSQNREITNKTNILNNSCYLGDLSVNLIDNICYLRDFFKKKEEDLILEKSLIYKELERISIKYKEYAESYKLQGQKDFIIERLIEDNRHNSGTADYCKSINISLIKDNFVIFDKIMRHLKGNKLKSSIELLYELKDLYSHQFETYSSFIDKVNYPEIYDDYCSILNRKAYNERYFSNKSINNKSISKSRSKSKEIKYNKNNDINKHDLLKRIEGDGKIIDIKNEKNKFYDIKNYIDSNNSYNNRKYENYNIPSNLNVNSNNNIDKSNELIPRTINHNSNNEDEDSYNNLQTGNFVSTSNDKEIPSYDKKDRNNKFIIKNVKKKINSKSLSKSFSKSKTKSNDSINVSAKSSKSKYRQFNSITKKNIKLCEALNKFVKKTNYNNEQYQYNFKPINLSLNNSNNSNNFNCSFNSNFKTSKTSLNKSLKNKDFTYAEIKRLKDSDFDYDKINKINMNLNKENDIYKIEESINRIKSNAKRLESNLNDISEKYRSNSNSNSKSKSREKTYKLDKYLDKKKDADLNFIEFDNIKIEKGDISIRKDYSTLDKNEKESQNQFSTNRNLELTKITNENDLPSQVYKEINKSTNVEDRIKKNNTEQSLNTPKSVKELDLKK